MKCIMLLILLFLTGCASYEAHFCPEEDCEQILIDFLNDSDDVNCALFDVDLENFINFLEEKNATVFVDESNEYFIPIKSKGLMHNKFCVAGNKVFTGSFNPTDRGANYNNNNMLLIRSTKIADEYRNYFSYLKNRSGYVEERSNIYFCPMDNCVDVVKNELSKAEKSIYFMTFSFTSREIANQILLKYYENVTIKGIYEKQQNSIYSTYWLLDYHGVGVKIDTNTYNMHHKVFIIDNKTVITGSFNPSNNANERNDENLVILKNKEIAKTYLKEFEKLYY